MSWHAPQLPLHAPITIYRGGRDDKGKSHAYKANSRDVLEIQLMRSHWGEDMTDDEWLDLCNRFAGRTRKNGVD